ncbi:hypothetical protein IID24_04245 [Patescibacteria group bacterium]|nr:hypothetical protein [Patescibacteria group bacterium]
MTNDNDKAIELAIELDRECVLKIIKEVNNFFKKESPFVYGVQAACEEIEYRLIEKWSGEIPKQEINDGVA